MEVIKKRVCCCCFKEEKEKKPKRKVEEWEKCFGHDHDGNRTCCWDTPLEWGKVFLGLLTIYTIMGGLWIALWYIYIAIRHTS